ncbi:hypothetical protein ACTFIW_010843 [Dictyostelium discoideum]
MNDLLFFKVWRNMIIRKHIGEFRNLLQIQFKNDLYFRISSKLISLKLSRTVYKKKQNILLSLVKAMNDENIILNYFYIERNRKRTHIETLFRNHGVLVRKNSLLINEYVDNLDPQKKSMPDMEILTRKYKRRLANFIENDGCLKELIENEIIIQKNRKINILGIEFKKYGIEKDYLKYPDKYLEFINTFKPKEIKKKGVWSVDQIIQQEIKKIYD